MDPGGPMDRGSPMDRGGRWSPEDPGGPEDPVNPPPWGRGGPMDLEDQLRRGCLGDLTDLATPGRYTGGPGPACEGCYHVIAFHKGLSMTTPPASPTKSACPTVQPPIWNNTNRVVSRRAPTTWPSI